MMTAHTASVIDSQTQKEIVLEGAGYNQACFFLDRVMPKGTFVGCCKGNSPFITIKYTSRTFWYDEDRMMLLGN